MRVVHLLIIGSGVAKISRRALKRLRNDNTQGEYYLTDIVGIGARQQRRVGALVWQDSGEVMGVNTRKEVKLAEMYLRKRTGKTS